MAAGEILRVRERDPGVVGDEVAVLRDVDRENGERENDAGAEERRVAAVRIGWHAV